jgi:hypothetical protein
MAASTATVRRQLRHRGHEPFFGDGWRLSGVARQLFGSRFGLKEVSGNPVLNPLDRRNEVVTGRSALGDLEPEDCSSLKLYTYRRRQATQFLRFNRDVVLKEHIKWPDGQHKLLAIDREPHDFRAQPAKDGNLFKLVEFLKTQTHRRRPKNQLYLKSSISGNLKSRRVNPFSNLTASCVESRAKSDDGLNLATETASRSVRKPNIPTLSGNKAVMMTDVQ